MLWFSWSFEGGKKVQKCKYCTEVEASEGRAASGSELFLPAAELVSALVCSLPLCWQLKGHTGILGTQCSFARTHGQAEQAGSW